MTSTDRLAEMAAEIERLRARIDDLEHNTVVSLLQVPKLQARIMELEALVTIGHGTMGTLQPDEPPTITHDIPPNAPR